MRGKIKQLIILLTKRPTLLFLIDAIGALLSACLLYVVLINFSKYFGMPEIILKRLSAIALLLCLYSSLCAFFLRTNFKVFVRVIGIANLLYCALTLGLVIIYYSDLTNLGIAYFWGEILVICGIAYLELSVAKLLSYNN